MRASLRKDRRARRSKSLPSNRSKSAEFLLFTIILLRRGENRQIQESVGQGEREGGREKRREGWMDGGRKRRMERDGAGEVGRKTVGDEEGGVTRESNRETERQGRREEGGGGKGKRWEMQGG